MVVYNLFIIDTALTWGCIENQIDACQYLLSEGADSKIITGSLKTLPICLCLISTTKNYDAAKDKRKAEFMKLLLDSYGKDYDFVNHRDCQGNTALHYASISSSYCSVLLLFEYGADLTIKNDAGLTALDFISRKISNSTEDTPHCDIYIFQELTKRWTELENLSRVTYYNYYY